jgi:cytochrome c peroxidase
MPMNVDRGCRGAVALGVLAVGLAVVVRADPPPWGPDRPEVRPSTGRTLRLPETPFRYADVDLPSHFKTPAARRFDNTPRDNPVTDAGAALGRALFYDTRLSANNTVACGTCHKQARAFSDAKRFSEGYEGRPTDRNAMSLVNLRYYPRGRFFWDERAGSLEDQVLVPIQSRTEMGQDLAKVVATLAADGRYPELYRKAFGDAEVTPRRTARALAQFVRSLVSYRSRYDEGLTRSRSVREDFENFTGQENRGKGLFLTHCGSCHLPQGQDAHFVLTRPLNNGLDSDVRHADGGVGDVTLTPTEVGLFKSPSLRNVELTAPYMHDGRFATLDAVLDHYARDVKDHPNLDGRARRRGLSAAERAALVAFLKTLTDHQFVTDPKFSDPFQ